MAKQHSISDTAASGGDLGFLQQEPFPEMVDALINLKAGEVSSVFKGPKGFYIVKLEEIKGGAQIPYEEIKQDIIQNRTLVKQQQVILDYIAKLEQEIKVEINEGLIK
jgi:parvulin-like peptidyl-prolyl isomerase